MRHSNVTKASEATSLAIHAMIILASDADRHFSVKDIAPVLSASEAHLSKVMQGLVRAGYIKSVRGPKGGFILGKPPGEISLLEIYELMEGAIQDDGCILGMSECPLGGCRLKTYLGKVNRDVRNYMSKTMLSDLKMKRGASSEHDKKDN